MTRLLSLEQILLVITKLFPCKLILRRLLHRLSFFWSFLRSRWRRAQNAANKSNKNTYKRPPNSSLTRPRRTPSGSKHDAQDLTNVTEPTVNFTLQKEQLSTNEETTAFSKPESIACSLHPYAFAGRNASRSSQNLGSVSMQDYTITYPLQDNRHLATPSPSHGFSGSTPYLPRPASTELLERPRTVSPVHFTVSIPGSSDDHTSGTPLSRNFSHPRIYPSAPEHFQRYDRKITIEKRDTDIMINPLTTSFNKRSNPPGWKSILHPEGALYFVNEEKRIYTDADLYEERVHSTIIQNVTEIERFVYSQNIRIPENVDLVLDLTFDEDGSFSTGYYYADHQTRSIFFLDECNASMLPVWSEVKGVTSHTHLRHEIESQYWFHCQLFPTAIDITQDHVLELRDIIMHAIGDTMTSPFSTAPYSQDELHKMLGLTNSLEKSVGTQYGGSTCLLSRLMFVFVRQRFYNFFGQPGARLNRDQSVYGTVTNERSYLITLLSPLLFSAPDVHLRNLEKMWVDGLMHSVDWGPTIHKLNTEWQEFTLYATVLLNANVAFLAIQSVDTVTKPYRSPAQIASYLSIITSIGSIILGLLLVRQNRTKARETADDALRFLHARTHPTLGLETLAIMFSLPYALLMWGMVGFLAAFCLMCFEDSNVVTRLSVGAAWMAIGILIVWCIWMAWERQQSTEICVPETDGDGTKETVESDHSNVGTDCVKRWNLNWPAFFGRPSCDSGTTAV